MPVQPPIQQVPGSFPGVMRPGPKVTTHLHLLPKLRMSGDVPLRPPKSLHGVQSNTFVFNFFIKDGIIIFILQNRVNN
jgi:hypothetical protein